MMMMREKDASDIRRRGAIMSANETTAIMFEERALQHIADRGADFLALRESVLSSRDSLNRRAADARKHAAEKENGRTGSEAAGEQELSTAAARAVSATKPPDIALVYLPELSRHLGGGVHAWMLRTSTSAVEGSHRVFIRQMNLPSLAHGLTKAQTAPTDEISELFALKVLAEDQVVELRASKITCDCGEVFEIPALSGRACQAIEPPWSNLLEAYHALGAGANQRQHQADFALAFRRLVRSGKKGQGGPRTLDPWSALMLAWFAAELAKCYWEDSARAALGLTEVGNHSQLRNLVKSNWPN